MSAEEPIIKLKELNQFYQTDIQLLINGAKVKRRQDPPNVKTLKEQIKNVLKSVAADGNTSKYDWALLRNSMIFILRDLLDNFNNKFKDSNTFSDEVDIILQYFVQFQKAPFTIQRICELIIEPERYYNSTKKLLYAFEKLVNVCEPEQRI